MSTNVTNELIYEHLRRIQSDLSELKSLRSEMREGFASIRQHLAAQHNDHTLLEYRLIALESEMDRIKRRLDLHE
jgi:septal ring factor EnvC (AmiA/AmiB activator)